MTRSAARWLGAAAIVVAAASAPRPATATDKPPIPKVLTEPRIAAQVKPGTVLIVHDEAAPVSFPTGKFNYGLLSSLMGSDAEIAGLQRRDPAAAQQKGVQRYVLPDPAKFFQVASSRTIPAEGVFTGSGAIVSGDGYIVTNAHVIAPEEDEVIDALIDDLSDEADDDIGTVLSNIDETLFGGSMSSDVEDALSSAYVDFLDENSEFGETTKSTVVLSGAADPSERKAKGRPAEVVEVGEGYPKKDVAVLKVQASNLYTLPLGDDADAVSGTKVFAVGYPGEATFDSGAAQGSQLEPSISSGTVSARRTVESGFSVIQHNAAIQHGSSGGPMVDESGRIIGLTTAGSNGDEPGTFYFSVPVTLVKEFLQRKNVTPRPSPATTQYIAALDQLDQRHYVKALKQLQALDRSSPGLPFVADRITATQKKIDAGENVSESSFPVVPAAIASALLVMLLLLAVGLGLRSRAKARRGPAVHPPTWSTSAPPPSPPAFAPPPPPAVPAAWPAPPPWPAPPADQPSPPPRP